MWEMLKKDGFHACERSVDRHPVMAPDHMIASDPLALKWLDLNEFTRHLCRSASHLENNSNQAMAEVSELICVNV